MSFLAVASMVSSCLAAPLVAGSLWMRETVVPVAETVLAVMQHVGSIYDMRLLVLTVLDW